MQKYKVIISGGGTGGHIYPAIAIANALKKINAETEILFVGALGKMEMQKVPLAGYQIVGLPIVGIQRKLTFSIFLFPFKVLISIWKARKVIKDFEAQIAVGVGGYASWPLLFAADLSNIPTIIQEQNGYAGVANKSLARSAKKICVAYPNMDRFFPKEKIVVTGNPVRSDIVNATQKKNEAIAFFNLDVTKKTIVIIGGSLGARTINDTIGDYVTDFVNANIQVVWQTGKTYFEKAKQSAVGFEQSIIVKDFIYEMDYLYSVADIVISRAGALSISELCIANAATILVPSPNVTEDHQTKNAMELVRNGAAILVKDHLANTELVPQALALLANVEQQNKLKNNIAKLAKPNAANEIAQIVINTIENNIQ